MASWPAQTGSRASSPGSRTLLNESDSLQSLPFPEQTNVKLFDMKKGELDQDRAFSEIKLLSDSPRFRFLLRWLPPNMTH